MFGVWDFIRRWTIPMSAAELGIDRMAIREFFIYLPLTVAHAFQSSRTLAMRGPADLFRGICTHFVLELAARRPRHNLRLGLLPSFLEDMFPLLKRFTVKDFLPLFVKEMARAPYESNFYVRFWFYLYEQADAQIWVNWVLWVGTMSLMLAIIQMGPPIVNAACFVAVNLCLNVLLLGVVALVIFASIILVICLCVLMFLIYICAVMLLILAKISIASSLITTPAHFTQPP